jgi:hypothetical protein
MLLLPPVLLAAIPKNAIGFSYPGGKLGIGIGAVAGIVTIGLGYLLASLLGLGSVPLVIWLSGGSSILILYSSVSDGIVFIKSLCSTCRLKGMIIEHEVLHLSGVESEEEVWQSAGSRHDPDGLNLKTDNSICDFCPIPKRFRPH